MHLQIRIKTNKIPIEVAARQIHGAISSVSAYVDNEEETQDGSIYYHFGLYAPNIRYSKFGAFSGIRLYKLTESQNILLKLYFRDLFFGATGLSILVAVFSYFQSPVDMSRHVLPILFPILVGSFVLLLGYLRVRHWINNIAS